MTDLANLYFDVADEPLLIEGSVDDDGHQQRHVVSFVDVVGVLGRSRSRQIAMGHVRGLLTWLRDTGVEHELWLRGELAATLRPHIDRIDAVIVMDPSRLRPGDRWLAQMVFASDVRLPPLELALTVVPPDDNEGVSLERTRCARRCPSPETGEMMSTGWLEVKL